MKLINNSFQKYKDIFQKNGLDFILLDKGENEKGRLVAFFNKLNSEFLFPMEQQEALKVHVIKLLDYAYNFILVDKENNCDVSLLSIYANDFITKTAFGGKIGILPSYRGGRTAFHLANFSLEFAKELGMDYFRVEVDKNNTRWLAYLMERKKFQIESENDNNSYILIRDLEEV
ncbi:GNAT family N-acetyltransferase [Neobacillus sp. YIM B02564]|uniref:GNAT family N-acetyltransferase n=1 Tax=Neobacillus paridis TaxID=2803862 RepID=A0ABS1TT21_9BACI|nr:GNAT family N-acetyltransferase [Neobacillus paridis]MBL4954466.1 GNAT family N-acetyltransferase [Neobacillus paridis]